ncbi:hypothetical protein N9117_03260, partial [Akkermansiaceae bacterium]|nr:hypothetical protein [Akkermansiaceae bacterium]
RASITQKKIWSSGFTNGWRCLKNGPTEYIAQNYKKTFKFIQISLQSPPAKSKFLADNKNRLANLLGRKK